MSNTKRKIYWHKLNRSLHRDVGYFCVGLVIIFAVSGIAVNHKNDWNPNYHVEQKVIPVPTQNWTLNNDEQLISQVLTTSQLDEKVKASYWASPTQFKVFFNNGSNLSFNLKEQQIIYEHIAPRHVFQAFNRLHLNETKTSWVIFSDTFAALLIFLALSGLFMIKGKHSPWGIKSLLVIIGIT
ncbi:MAG: PepSY-associated TM helix domain-containing protein, partial [Pseudoalteromonas sp.]